MQIMRDFQTIKPKQLQPKIIKGYQQNPKKFLFFGVLVQPPATHMQGRFCCITDTIYYRLCFLKQKNCATTDYIYLFE